MLHRCRRRHERGGCTAPCIACGHAQVHLARWLWLLPPSLPLRAPTSVGGCSVRSSVEISAAGWQCFSLLPTTRRPVCSWLSPQDPLALRMDAAPAKLLRQQREDLEVGKQENHDTHEPEPELQQPQPLLVRAQPGSSTIRGRHAVLSDVRPGRDAAAVAYQHGERYDSVILGVGPVPIERNSVLLIPDLLTAEECRSLIEAAEQRHADAPPRQGCEKKQRLWVRELSASTGELVDKMLHERLLPFISTHLPTVEDYMWARSKSAPEDACSNLAPLRQKRKPEMSLSSLQYRFSPRVRLASVPQQRPPASSTVPFDTGASLGCTGTCSQSLFHGRLL